MQAHRVLLDLRHLWRAGRDADPRRHAAAPGQSLWREQADGRARARTGTAWRMGSQHVSAALFQRRRRRSRRRDRRGARARDPSHPAGPRRRARAPRARSTSTAPIIRRQTAPRSATTSMSRIWPRRMSRRSQYLEGGGASVALNLGTGQGHSVREVIAAAERVTGRPIPQRETPRRAGRPAHPGRRCEPRRQGAGLAAAASPASTPSSPPPGPGTTAASRSQKPARGAAGV